MPAAGAPRRPSAPYANPSRSARVAPEMKRGILSLPPKSQEDLRQLTERAIEVGRLLSSVSAQG